MTGTPERVEDDDRSARGGLGSDGRDRAARGRADGVDSDRDQTDRGRAGRDDADQGHAEHGLAEHGHADRGRGRDRARSFRDDPGGRASRRTARSLAVVPTGPTTGAVVPSFDYDEFFGPQPTALTDLPDPEPLLTNLTTGVIEVLAGARDLEQLARWVTDDVYAHLLRRTVLAAKARQVRRQDVRRPQLTIGSIRWSSPRDGVVEAVVIVHQRARSRAVAIRLEGLDRRWRAAAIAVL